MIYPQSVIKDRSTLPVGTMEPVVSLLPFTSICKKSSFLLSAASSAKLLQEESWICLFKRLPSLQKSPDFMRMSASRPECS